MKKQVHFQTPSGQKVTSGTPASLRRKSSSARTTGSGTAGRPGQTRATSTGTSSSGTMRTTAGTTATSSATYGTTTTTTTGTTTSSSTRNPAAVPGGHTHVYRDGRRKGYFGGTYEDQAPPPRVRFAENVRQAEARPRFLLLTKPRLVKSDMQADLLDYVVQTTQACIDRYKDDIDISRCIKMKLESRFQGCWVVIVGANYATFVTEDCFQPGTFSYFFVGKQGFLVFKCF